MTRTTRRLTVIGALLAFAGVGEIVREQYAPITEQYARKAAEAQFEKLCRDFHLQPPDYEPPVPTNVGGADTRLSGRASGRVCSLYLFRSPEAML